MASSLRDVITDLLGPESISEDGSFGVKIESKEAEDELAKIISRYSGELEELPSDDPSTRIFRILPSISSEVEQLQPELASLISSYLSDDDPLIVREQGDPLHLQTPFVDPQQDLRDLAAAQIHELTTVVKDHPDYYRWFSKHRHLTSLHLKMSGKFSAKQSNTILTRLGAILDSFDDLTSLKIDRLFSSDDLKPFKSTLKRLKSLDLRGSLLRVPLDDEFYHLPNLEILNLEATMGSDEQIDRFLRLASYPRLTSLNLTDINLSYSQFEAFFSMLKLHPRITSLVISGTGDDLEPNEMDRVVEQLSEILPSFPHLETLGVGRFTLDDKAPKFCQALETLQNLTDIDVSRMGWNYKVLGASLAKLPKITHFTFTGNDSLGDNAMMAMLPFIKTHPNLRSLNLEDNSFAQDEENGTSSFAIWIPYLSRMTHLEILNLEESNIKTEDFRFLIMVLTPSLTELNLTNCQLRFDEFMPLDLLIETLTRCQNLRKLELGHNQFSFNAFELMLPLFKHIGMMGLEELDIRHCDLDSISLNHFIECLPSMPNLKVLVFEDNDAETFDYPRFFEVAKHLVHLQVLHIPEKGMDESQFEAYHELETHLPDRL